MTKVITEVVKLMAVAEHYCENKDWSRAARYYRALIVAASNLTIEASAAEHQCNLADLVNKKAEAKRTGLSYSGEGYHDEQ